MARPRHALTLWSKAQMSNPNPEPLVRVLTFAMGMGRDVQQLVCAHGYDCTFFYLLSIFITWQQLQSKHTFAWSAC